MEGEFSRYDRRESSDQRSNGRTLKQWGRNRHRRKCQPGGLRRYHSSGRLYFRNPKPRWNNGAEHPGADSCSQHRRRLFVGPDRQQPGGVISGPAVIKMDVAGNANMTNDATLAIYGSDGAIAARFELTVVITTSGALFSAISTGMEQSHSIVPALTQIYSKPAYLAQTACSISAVAICRLTRY